MARAASLRSRGQVELTDFRTLVATWRQQFSSQACVYTVKTGMELR
jgi:hypothetical protein